MNEQSQKSLDRALDTIEAAEGLMNMNKMEIARGWTRLLRHVLYCRGFTCRKGFGV